uniref:hypothetical protein n=2 Tax=Bacteria TaxID=2 RepID=UPI0019631635
MSDFHDLSFANALIADAPTAKYPNRMSRFGRLVGRWNVHSRRMDEATGHWHESDFTWVVGFILDGQAVQDVALISTDDGFKTIS